MTDTNALPEGTHLAYTIYHETSWWRGLPENARPNDGRPTIQVAASAKGAGGGVAWEFAVVEMTQTTLYLEVFDDAWQAFAQIPAFFESLPDCDTLDAVQALLDLLGAVDETERGVTRTEERRNWLRRARVVLDAAAEGVPA
jgi:hypothetical protein